MKKSIWITMIVAVACILSGLACIAVGHGLGGHRILSATVRPSSTEAADCHPGG